MKSDLRATKDELKVVEEDWLKAEKVATIKKDQNALPIIELDWAKSELVDYKAGEESCWA